MRRLPSDDDATKRDPSTYARQQHTPPKEGPPPPARGRAAIRIDAGECFFKAAKVDDEKAVFLEPYADLELAPGHHRIAGRTDEDEPWERLQSFHLEVGGAYVLTLREHGSGDLERIDQPYGADTSSEDELPMPPLIPSSEQPVTNPVVGSWREVQRISCEAGERYVPAVPIEELVIWASGDLRLTWTPFETYFDYNGHYGLDLERNELTLFDLGGNFIPPDVDKHGRFERRGKQLVLQDMWLGSSEGAGAGERACGHVFAPE